MIMVEPTDEMITRIVQNEEEKTMIAHYTTIEAIHGMISSATKENGTFYINLWASNIFALNDPDEFRYGYHVLQKWLPEVESELNVMEDEKLSRIWSIAGIEKKKHSFLNEELEQSIYNQEKTPYVLSFSHEIDNLPMFRMYSNDASGICIVFSYARLKNTLRLYDVCYDSKIHKHGYSAYNMLKSVYRQYLVELHEHNLENSNKFKFMLERLVSYTSIIAAYIKCRDYKYEEEMRHWEQNSPTDGVKFRMNKNGNIIPYKNVPIPLDAISQLIIGPCADFETTEYMIDLNFKSKGIKEIPPIVKSNIKYRRY